MQNETFANSNISGILNGALEFHEVKYCFKTTNNITNVNVYQQQISLDQATRKEVSLRNQKVKLGRLHYEYAYCNRKNMIRHHGITKGYYIHCDKPIFNIKIQRNPDEIIIMDKKYIETECKQINYNTLYVPLQSGHISGGYICMTINETENFCNCMSSMQVCIISEHIVDVVYNSGMFTVTSIYSDEGIHKYNNVLCSS